MSALEMAVTDAHWKAPDGAEFYLVEWRPPQPRAAVLLIHGLGEHSRRYDHVAQAFCHHGIAVLGFDHRGHGRSQGKRGHLPWAEKAPADIDHFLSDLKERFPGLPCFIYGHSMGGVMALEFAIKRNPKISGVICTSPGLSTAKPVPKAKLFLANLLYSLLPSFTLDNGLDVNNLSHDRQVVEAYRHDPLVTPQISSMLGLDLINTGRWVEENAEDFSHPLLLMQGTGDTIVSLEAVRRFAARVPRDLITYHEFAGMFHELHNEPGIQSEFLTSVANWIHGRSK
jgi:alpha-beta hydrolase superfamily lysophospholipase